ncbi:hypothetical protein VTK73DRAFT_2249 [Phialemonium thermophilum]|uniref:Metallo-beta-lactamase domain-containing protein n=1 Tax=Phialemonium thermophilum TaxID=223376 RepID=A0ABR3VSG3_9PEZI
MSEEFQPLPPPGETAATVILHALSAGHFSLPEEQFIRPATAGSRRTVPSLCFFIQHRDAATGASTRIVFDLGLRRDVSRYAEPIRRHVATRQPMTTDPDVVKSLARGGVAPDDVDYVIYSHVHWDHVGEPRDFARSTFVVGRGSLDLLRGRFPGLRGGHSFFEADLLDPDRTIELLHPEDPALVDSSSSAAANFLQPWRPFGPLPSTIDVFRDGSLFVVDAPGHLPGHVNLLARTARNNDDEARWVYLAGDACHDRRILRGERAIGEWLDAHGHICCIHADRERAEATIETIRRLESSGVEVIFAHDVEWESDERNRSRFLGADSDS